VNRSAATLARLTAAVGLVWAGGCRREPAVVVYTSVDQVYAEEVFAAFEAATGVRVRPAFDTEAGKTTGLFKRLLAERGRPAADVFWNNEISRTIQLADAGVADDLSDLMPADLPRQWVDADGRWCAFSLRARVIVYNTNLLKPEEAPTTLAELTQPAWRGKVAMANPLFGTTASHMAALYETWGDTKAERWFTDLKANGLRLVEGNSVVRDVVARGEVPVGLTDTDDVFSGIRRGDPIQLILPDQDGMGAFAIPNSVILVKGGPHPELARQFVRFLTSPAVEERLAFLDARQLPVRPDVKRPDDLKPFEGLKTMKVDYRRVAERMPATAERMRAIFQK